MSYYFSLKNIEIECETMDEIVMALPYIKRYEAIEEEPTDTPITDATDKRKLLTHALHLAKKNNANLTPLQRATLVLATLLRKGEQTPTQLAAVHGYKPVSIGPVLKPLRAVCNDRGWNIHDYMTKKMGRVDGKQQSIWFATDKGDELLAAAMQA